MPRKKQTEGASAPDPIEVAARAAYEARMRVAETSGDAKDVAWDDAPEDVRNDAIAAVEALKEHPDATIEQFHGLVGDGKVTDLPPDEVLKIDAFYRSARASLGMTNASDTGKPDETPTVEQAAAERALGETIVPAETVETADGVVEVLAATSNPAASMASAAGEPDEKRDAEVADLARQLTGDAANVDSAAVHLSRILTGLGVTKPDDALLSIATLKAAHRKSMDVDGLRVHLEAARAVLGDVQKELGIGDAENPVPVITRLKAAGNDVKAKAGEPERDGRKDRSLSSQFDNLPTMAKLLVLNASARAQGLGPAYRGTPRSIVLGDTEWTVVDDPETLRLVAETNGSTKYGAMHKVNTLEGDVANAVERERMAGVLVDQVAHASSKSPEQAEALATRKESIEKAHDESKEHLARLNKDLAAARKVAADTDVVTYEFPALLMDDEAWA